MTSQADMDYSTFRDRKWSPPRFTEDALCSETDPEAFFPESGSSYRKKAIAICKNCPAMAPCFDYAMGENGQEYETVGIWGGYSAQERLDMRMGRKPLPEWAKPLEKS